MLSLSSITTRFYKRIIFEVNSALYNPHVKLVKNKLNIVELGSKYGKKKFVKRMRIAGFSAILAGCGEDVSFDLELTATFNAKIFLVDPTPKAVKHLCCVESIGTSEIL